MQWSLGPQEFVDLAIDRALAPPLYNRVKQEPVDRVSKSRVKKEHQKTVSTFQHSHRNDNSLITPIRILLPSIQFIIHAERYTFFEASLGVSGPAGYQDKFRDKNKDGKERERDKNGPDDVTFQDKTQCHIKILGNVRFRPDLFLPISWINEDGVLDRFPSQETTRLSIIMSAKFGAN